MIAILVTAIVCALIFSGVMFAVVMKKKASLTGVIDDLKSELQTREELRGQLEALYIEMIPLTELAKKIDETRTFEESLKAERGRITITQAELETVESRLRELDEIERELEASGLETKEELTILQKKEKELHNKNEKLKSEIEQSKKKIDDIITEIEMSSEIQEQVQGAQGELLQTEEKIDTLLLQIEQGNEQYFILKRRYDALDIEYAQLYEKFAEAEEDDDDE